MNLTACTTWECINSFANWLSAIGTISISGLALWLSIRDRLINLKVSLRNGFIPGGDPMIIDRKVFIIEYVNSGPRPVTINNHAWSMPFTRGKSVLFPHLDRDVGVYCSRFPIELTDGKTAHTFYKINFFHQDLESPEKMFFHPSWWKAWLRIYLFSLRVSTSIGKQVKVKVSPSVRRILWEQYLEWHSNPQARLAGRAQDGGGE